MSRLKEAVAKRKNLAAKYVVPFLEGPQIDALNERLGGLTEGEDAEAAQQAFLEEQAWLRLTVTRVADQEYQDAEESAREQIPILTELNKQSDDVKIRAYTKFLRLRRNALWPILLRSIVKAEQRDDDSKWIDAALAEVKPFLQNSTSREEHSFFVKTYIAEMEKDREARERDPKASA